MLRGPANLVSGALPPGLVRGAFTVVGGASENAAATAMLGIVWSHRYGFEAVRSCNNLVHSLWLASTESLGALAAYGSFFEYRSVFGIPVGAQAQYPKGWMVSPATNEEILTRARGQNWLFEQGEEGVIMLPDSAEQGTIVDSRTRALIDDIRSVPGCRARLLWGPPRAGKSVAAVQIVQAVAGSWARICGSVCASPDVWRALDVLRPPGLIIDDIDVSAGNESPLMRGLEQARKWARVIISTANVVPRVGSRDANALRGAVVGRASDGALVEYRALSPEVRRALAPGVPDSLGADDLLAQYQVELQRRHEARGIGPEDVEELRHLQSLVGER
jgi:hypothetical protein